MEAALIKRLREELAAGQGADGGWGYVAGNMSRPEPTLLATAVGGEGVAWLASAELGWVGLLAPAVLWNRHQGLALRCLARMDSLKGRPVADVSDFDGSLPGWGWAPGNAAWVVPTAMAALSLRRAGDRAETLALAFLSDRRCQDGGWNYGNPRVNGRAQPSQPEPTAWAVLASPRGSIPTDGVLRRWDGEVLSARTLALLLLAAAAHGFSTATWAARLRARMERAPAPLDRRLDHCALAVAALERHEGASCPFTGDS